MRDPNSLEITALNHYLSYLFVVTVFFSVCSFLPCADFYFDFIHVYV